ncbi:MAG: DUF881 domain-containing protein [bacterium]
METEPTKKYSLAQNIGYFIAMGGLLLILGFIISIQTKKYIEVRNSEIPAERRLNELVLLLKESQNKKTELEGQLIKLRQQVQKLGKESLSSRLADRQFQKLYQIAGLTTIKGKGITIKFDNDKNLKKIPLNNNDGFIQSDDLLKVINELKASGAKAIAINNQRLITTSEIVTAGNSIMVNQSRLIPPYLIKAIGPSDTMISALKIRGGIVEYLEAFDIKVHMETKSDIIIPPYTGNLL